MNVGLELIISFSEFLVPVLLCITLELKSIRGIMKSNLHKL